MFTSFLLRGGPLPLNRGSSRPSCALTQFSQHNPRADKPPSSPSQINSLRYTLKFLVTRAYAYTYFRVLSDLYLVDGLK